MRLHAAVVALALLSEAMLASQSPPANREATSAKSAAASRPQRAGKAKSSTTHRASTRKPRRRNTRAGQQAPTRERYTEIQQALIARGYGAGPATGVWGPEWAEAVKRFQRDNGLEITGKLNSLTLIALGLGPNHKSAPDSSGLGPGDPPPR